MELPFLWSGGEEGWGAMGPFQRGTSKNQKEKCGLHNMDRNFAYGELSTISTEFSTGLNLCDEKQFTRFLLKMENRASKFFPL